MRAVCATSRILDRALSRARVSSVQSIPPRDPARRSRQGELGDTTMSTQPSHPNQPSELDPQQPSAEAPATGAPDGWPEGWPYPLPPLGSDPAIIASTPPAILEAQRVYLQDLPELLKTHRGHWVAYYGAERLGFGATKTALCEE